MTKSDLLLLILCFTSGSEWKGGKSVMKKLMNKTNDIETIDSSTYSNVKIKATAVMTALYCTLMTSLPAFADDAIKTGIQTGAQKIWDILKAVVLPLAAVALAICAVKILWGGQRAAEEAKGTAIKIMIAIALVLLAPALVDVVGKWFSGNSNWSFSIS